jgi:ribosomal protein S18 acetylase RimI-like enzyme
VKSEGTSLRPVLIKPFENTSHRSQVIALWKGVFGYQTAHNRPTLAIDKKLDVSDALFFVALLDDVVVGTAMAGYDGHRGWIYSVAVHPLQRKQGIGSQLVLHAERALTAKGCMKINLQILQSNKEVAAFYLSLGYVVEERVSMSKLIGENIP